MQIGLAADTYKPYVSGVTNYLYLVKSELARTGHNPFLFAFGSKKIQPPEKNVVLSPGFKLLAGYSIGLGYSQAAQIQMADMDLIHIHHPFVTGHLVCSAFAGQKPLLFTAHSRYDHLIDDYLPGVLRWWGRKVARRRLVGFCQQMDRVICNSEASVAGLRNCGVDVEVEVVHNGIDTQRFRGARVSPDWREKMGGWPVQLLYTGRLAVEKDLPLLLNSFEIVAKEHPEVGLALAGGGPMEKEIRKKVLRSGLSERVRLLGSVAYESIPELTASADLFVMPSSKETHPLNVIEAMAAGLPTLVVQSQAYQETIEDGVHGLICAPTEDDFSRGMRLFINDENLRIRLGAAAKEKARQFSISETTRKLVAIYQEVLSCRERRGVDGKKQP